MAGRESVKRPTSRVGRRLALPHLDQITWPASLAAMAHRDFRLLWTGTVLTQTGQWMQQVALGWLVLDLTGSAFYLGLAGFLRAIPQLLLSLPGGILADRVNRSRLLGTAQAVAAGLSLILATVVASGHVQIWQVLLLTFLIGSAMAMVFPVRQALVPNAIPREDVANAIGLNSAGNNVTRVAGPALAGVLIGVLGVALCFFLHAFLLFSALWTSLAMRTPSFARDVPTTSALQSLREAFAFIRKNGAVSALLVTAVVPTTFGMPYISFLPSFARDLGIGASGLGLLMMSSGVGSVIGSIGFAAAGSFRHKGLVQLVAAGCFGLALVGLGFVSALPLVILMLVAAGTSSAIYMATNNTLLQTLAPDHLRGRIMSVYLLSWGMMPLGTLPLGVLADQLGASVAVALGGALCVVFVALVGALRPELRSLE